MFADDTNRAVTNLKLPENGAFLSARKYQDSSVTARTTLFLSTIASKPAPQSTQLIIGQ
jgi:hypothetical protein